MSTPQIVRALRHRNFRLFFVGQGISLIGTWLTRFAIGYETYALSHSAFELGLVAFFSQVPTAVIAPFAGTYADRWDRHRALVITQVLALLQSAALAAFAISGTMTVWHLLVLGVMQAVINAFDMPVRQAFVRQMVEDRADLPNAIALNSALVNGGRLAGPAIAAALVGLAGVGGCFAIDAASYIAVVVSLLAMRVTPRPAVVGEHRVLRSLGEGIDYVRGERVVRDLLLLVAVTSTLGGAYAAMLPAVAEGSLHGDAGTLGWLMGAAGLGALLAAIYLAARDTTVGLGRVVANGALVLGGGMIALEAAPQTWDASIVMFFIGGGLMLQWTATNTLVQTMVPDDKLGRVMSLLATTFFAGAPLGALVEGSLATVVGPIHAFAVAGVGCVVGALAFRRALTGASVDEGLARARARKT